ncbi:MAG: selenocysteine-specific translation elongation factor [Bacillota bacterium]|nr:selenocysteine-specific translation elongation factor [Bacillota bacterium]
MKRLIIGTAGHIDHGKTTLVRALTGKETDRLKEEKQRGISIELGFAPFQLPGGQKAAIVDVPGHERFIRHMLAGAFGVDMVLFTIAADEGVMPQTREHMDIIELLGVNKGIIVITKKDMVDEEWLMLVEEEIEEYINHSILKGSPIVKVSGITGEGIPELLTTIDQMAETVEEKSAFGHARFPIDRVFTISGFGTVVTGTLWSGTINVGDTLELMPDAKPVKVRTLQVHNEKVQTALAGQRVAVNLQGIEVKDIKRGNLLASPGYMTPSYRVDAKLRLLSSSPRSIKNWNRIRFHLGTDEKLGRVVLLDRDELLPGEEAYVQIAMEKQVVAYKGDPFVLRYYSPVTTIGGGAIIDPAAPKQKRFREDVLEEMAVKEEGTLYDIILHELENAGYVPQTMEELSKRTGSPREEIEEEIQLLIDDEKVIDINGKGTFYISQVGLWKMNQEMLTLLNEYHLKYPLRKGYPKEDMRSRLFKNINSKMFGYILKYMEENQMVNVMTNLVTTPGYRPEPGEKQKNTLEKIMAIMKDRLFMPPSIEEIQNQLGTIKNDEFNEIILYLTERGDLVKINETMYFSNDAIEKGKEIMEEYFQKEKDLPLATARDLFNTTRKYALPLIEYYDKIRFTRRVGDLRVQFKTTP